MAATEPGEGNAALVSNAAVVSNAALVSTDVLFGLLVDAVAEYAIFLVGPDGTVRTWNAGAQRIKGYREHEVIGRHFSMFYPAEDVGAGKPERELAAAARDGSCTDDGWRVRADGSRFWAHVVITALREKGELRGFAKVTRDDTAGRAARTRATALAEITAALLAGHDTPHVLALIAGHARRLVGAAQAWISSPRGDDEILIRAVDGSLPGPTPGDRVAAAGTVAEQVIDAGEPLFIDDLPTVSSLGGRVAGAGPALAVPIVVAEAVTGVLIAAAPAGGSRFRRSDLDLLQQFADQAAVVLEYGRAQNELRERSVAEDRERIAVDLQAHIIQELSWTAMSLQGAQPYATQPLVRERMQEAVDRLDGAIRRMREAIFSLGPEAPAEPEKPGQV
jgi:PAS domain S-box-containing protein